jgi:hypothetical protein
MRPSWWLARIALLGSLGASLFEVQAQPFPESDVLAVAPEPIERVAPDVSDPKGFLGGKFSVHVLVKTDEEGKMVRALASPVMVLTSTDPVETFAIEMVKQWRFYPATVAGEPARMLVQVPVSLVPKAETPVANRLQPEAVLTPVDLFPERRAWPASASGSTQPPEAAADTALVRLKSAVWPSTRGHKVKKVVTVQLGVEVGVDGAPEAVWAFGSEKLGILARSTRRAAEKWTWRPATLNGIPVGSSIVVPFTFDYRDETAKK